MKTLVREIQRFCAIHDSEANATRYIRLKRRLVIVFASKLLQASGDLFPFRFADSASGLAATSEHTMSAGVLQMKQSRLHASSCSHTACTYARAPFTAGSRPLIKPTLSVTRSRPCSWVHTRTSATYTVDRVGLPPCASVPLQVSAESKLLSQ